MLKKSVMSEPVSQEVFEQFQSSNWPFLFGSSMRHSDSRGNSVNQAAKTFRLAFLVSPREDRAMLEEMGIIEQHTVRSRTKKVGTDRLEIEINDAHMTNLGKEVMLACNGLFSEEEYDVANEVARVKLQALHAEYEADIAPRMSS